MSQQYHVLSIDGGGIRGIISAVWAHRLETLLGQPLHYHFDLFAGTSTGAILAAGLSQGKSAEECLNYYRLHGSTVFPLTAKRFLSRAKKLFTDGVSAPRYKSEGLVSVCQTVFGEEPLLSSLHKPTLITSYNLLNRRAQILKSHKPEHRDIPLWSAVTASCSAPTYFPAHVVRVGLADLPLIDGGVVATNPAGCAMAEAMRITRDNDSGLSTNDIVLVSLGTGQTTRNVSIDEAMTWGPLEWAPSIVDIVCDGGCDAVSYMAKNILAPENFFRLQTRLDHANDDMDNADPANINALISVAEHYLNNKGGREQIEKIAEKLTSRQPRKVVTNVDFSKEQQFD